MDFSHECTSKVFSAHHATAESACEDGVVLTVTFIGLSLFEHRIQDLGGLGKF
jgi:hypothetical protein